MKSLLNRRSVIFTSVATSFVAGFGFAATPDPASQKAAAPVTPQAKTALPTAPHPAKKPFEIEQLGYKRSDDYHWMKDDNWQAVLRDPSLIKADVKAALTEENAYSAAMLASTQDLQTTIFEEMKGRIKEDDASVPSPDGPWEYYSRYEKGGQHPILARRPRSTTAFLEGVPSIETTKAVEYILLNEDERAKGHDYYETSGAQHSPDHALYAWGEDIQGSEYYTIHVRDLKTGEILPGNIPSSDGSFVFSKDSQYIYWIWRDENSRPAKVFRRPARGGEDVLIYEEKDDGFFINISMVSSEAFVVIGAGDHETSESWIIPSGDPTALPVVVEPRTVGLKYDIDHWDDRFIIYTNADDAIDFKVMRSTAAVPTRSSWVEFVPHRPGVYVTGAEVTKRHMIRTERENANTRIVITRKSDLSEHAISVDEEAYSLGGGIGFEYDTDIIRYGYTSPTTPSQTFGYNMETREKVLLKTQTIPSGHNPADYTARRLYATAPDGEKVPVTVLMKAGTKLDGSAPLLLYGYGSYGIPMDPTFSIRSLSLVNRGWIYAIAHIRGGTEKGYGWFLDGRKYKKKNTFTDFIAACESLCDAGYGTRGKVVAYGGSAGGMLMGAIANMRPDLWAGVIGAVPFVDVLNTMSDTSLPLTPPEWPEWGNPLEDKQAYDYILSYSPYDNIDAKPYPPVLATGGLSDPRVTYWEPMKWIAKLREKSTSGAPMLLKINMEAGHGGASGRFDFLKEIAFDYAFAIWAHDKGWLKA
ncbi:peptidase S9 [Asticcacaulis sp. AC460]|uniref:S9 family peptidase n=1 Tax=Asticcacaulis sp. AC460 TaxID=1282360 RepID=UPI0003C3FE97|nr:S9 family peptidase [Asticcacaulis sp. AC460]ESQ89295.1 peptidase S9 [Asticcacaulis sp. AC460]